MAEGTWRLAIGEPFAAGVTSWPDNRFEYRFFSGNHLLQICVSSPKKRDLDNFSKGRVFVALRPFRSVLFFMFKIEGFYEWSDQGISVCLVPLEDRDRLEHQAGTHIPLNIVLVDADTGKVAAMRMVTFSPQFSELFLHTFRQQLVTAFDPALHTQSIAEAYNRWPSTKDMVAAAAIMERAGAEAQKK